MKAIVFKDLLAQVPGLGVALTQAGFEAVPVGGGREALTKTSEFHSGFVLLDVAMPQMSGVEVCRQLKEGSGPQAPKVVLVSSIASPSIAQRALDVGCDLLTSLADASNKIPPFLETLKASGTTPSGSTIKSEPVAPEIRGAPRVEIPCAARCVVDGQEIDVELVNASKSGVLVATKVDYAPGTPLLLKLAVRQGEDVSLNAAVVRTVRMKEPRGAYVFAVGAKFTHLAEEDQARVQELLQSVAASSKRLQLTPEFVRRMLEATVDTIRTAVLGGETDPPMQAILGEVMPAERAAFGEETPEADCMRRLVLLRVQCTAFELFVPSIQAQRGVLAGPFLGFLPALLENSDRIEEEVNRLARAAVAAGNEEQRQTLNVSSNRLYEAKTKLLFSIARTIPAEGLGAEGAVLKTVLDRVAFLESLQKGGEPDLKYARRAPPPPPKEEKKKPQQSLLKSTSFRVVSILVVLGVGGFFIYNFIASRVAPEQIKLPVASAKAKLTEDGLEVTIDRASWTILTVEQRDEFLQATEDFLAQKFRTQAKVFDENGKLMVAILGGRVGRKIVYSRRILK